MAPSKKIFAVFKNKGAGLGEPMEHAYGTSCWYANRKIISNAYTFKQ